MRPRRSPQLLAAVAVGVCLLVLPASGVRAGDMGYSALWNYLNSRGLPMPTGAGIPVTQVEALYLGHANEFMPDTSAFPGKTFHDLTGGGTTSSHATAVGNFFYGSWGVTSGISVIDNYSVDNWVGSGFLRYGSASGPASAPVENPRVMNHSWIGTWNSDAADNDILRRLDYTINRDRTVVVVGVNNGAGTTIPSLLASAYNAIAVGLTNSTSSLGPTTSGLGALDGPGRAKPDIVAAQDQTSFAAPTVSGASTMLLQVANGTYANAYNNPEVIKAILMAGTDKNAVSSWVRTQTRPLDLRYGAGEMNYFRAYQILTAGEQTPGNGATVSATGWDYGTNIQANNAQSYYFDVAPGQAQDFSALLTWNRHIPYSGSGAFPSTSSLATINLKLYQAGSDFSLGALVDQSVSTIDNVQNIFQRTLPSGRYALQVTRTDALSESWNYALAWQSLASTVVPVWNGGAAGDNNWTTGANWSGGTPTAPQGLVFGALAPGGHATNFNNFALDTQFGGIVFRSDAPAYNLLGNRISLSGAVANQSGNDQSIGLGITLMAGAAFDTGARKITVTGAIAGAGMTLTKNGTGTLVFTGNNTYSGPTTVNAGTLQIGNGNSSGAVVGNVVLQNNSSLVFNRSNDVTYAGSISGNGSLTKTGAGTLSLTGANAHSGITTVSQGTLALGNVNALQNTTLDTGASGAQQVTFTVPGNKTYFLGGLTGADALAIAANTISVGANGGSTTFSGAISGPGGGLTKTGIGTLTLAGTNTYGGATAVNGGTLLFDSTAAVGGIPGNRDITINAGGAVALNAADLTANLFPRLVQSSSGVIALTSTNATENVDFNAAGFTAAGLGAVGAVAYSGTLTPSGATYRLGGGGGTLTMSLADALTGARSLVVNGNVTLPAANNFAGGTTLNAGVLALGTDSSIGNGALTLGGGALQSADGGPRTLANTLNSLAGNVTIGGSGDVTFSDTAVTALGATRTFTIDNPKTTFAQQFSGAGVGITKAGAGILILSGANTYSGPTSVNGGTVRLANASGLGSTAAGTVVVLGELDLNGLSLGSETLTLNGSGIGGNGALTNSSAIAAGLSGAVALGSAAAIGGAGDITLSGAFDYGAFALTKTGADKLILGGPQTWGNGASATVQSGTLRYELGGSQTVAVGTGNSATIANAATLELAGSKSALSDGTRHVNVVNNSTSAAGLMIVGGTNQAVGGISGSGSTSVQANASLTADYIVQDTLTIGSGGSVTIRPMVSGLVAGSTYSAPTGYAGVTNLAGIGDAASITSGASLDSVVPPSGGFASVSIVPEPGLCVLLATAAACLGWRFRRRRPYSSSFCNSL